MAAFALQSAEAAFVTFTAGFSENSTPDIAVIYAQTLKIFGWTTDPDVTVYEIRLFSVDGDDRETLISSKQEPGSSDMPQTPTTTTPVPATGTGSNKRHLRRNIEDGVAGGGLDTTTLALDCEHQSPLGPGNKNY